MTVKLHQLRLSVMPIPVCCYSLLQNNHDDNRNKRNSMNGTLKRDVSLALERQGGTLKPNQSVRLQKRISMYARSSHSKLNFGEPTDDVHLCIMCLRAIMNHQVWPLRRLTYFLLCALCSHFKVSLLGHINVIIVMSYDSVVISCNTIFLQST